MHITRSDPGGFLKISGTLDISVAEALRQSLTECMDRESSLTVDLSEVDSCDTAALQLFYAARKTATRSNKLFAVSAFSAPLALSCATLGFRPEELKSEEFVPDV